MNIDLNFTLTQLIQVLPEFFAAFFIAALLTPLMGKFAKLIGAIDLPATLRKRSDRTLETRIHKKPLPRLGGVAIFIAFISLIFYIYGFTLPTVSLGLSVSLLAFAGILDDKFDLHGGVQILFQILAVLVIIFAGTRILEIDIFGAYLNLERITIPFEIFDQALSFIFPADVITLVWFLIIINAMNWVAGIDALEETMGWIAGITLMLIAIKYGKNDMLPYISIFTGATIGFWLFNFPPAKILGGTVGNTMIGFLLAVFSIQIDGKFTTTLLLLAVPLVDFVWVLSGRIINYRVINPARLMTISGKHHLHHRLMALGYSTKQILLIEISIFSIFGVMAYYMAGFNKTTLMILSGIGTLLIFFSIMTIVKRIRSSKKWQDKKQGEIVKEGEVKEAPEKVYAY